MVIFVVWDLFRNWFSLSSVVFSQRVLVEVQRGFARFDCCENTVSSIVFIPIQEVRQKKYHKYVQYCSAKE